MALQAVYRGRRQQSLYGEMKAEMVRRRAEMEAAREEQEEEEDRRRRRQRRSASQERRLSASSASASASARSSPEKEAAASSGRAVAQVAHLEVPAELAFLLAKLVSSQPTTYIVIA